ncbi:MAG: MFS transporter [Bacteroidales bacterium]|nr:MFS transporter [Bacteroidales bacterium]
MSNERKNNALPIVMMFALYFMISFVTGLQNPMGVIIKNQFGVTNFLATLGNFMVFIAYALMGMPAGSLLQKIGYRKTALVADVIGLLGVLVIFLSGRFGGFPVFLVGAFISGIAICMLNTVVNPLTNALGGGGRRGNQLIQFGGTFNSLGATIVPIFVGALVGDATKAMISDATPALMLAIIIFILAFIVFSLVKIPEPFLAKANDNVTYEHSPLAFRHFMLGCIAIFFYVGVEVGIPNIANLYMTNPNGLAMDTAVAGTVCGTYWFLMLIGRLIGGFVGMRVGSRPMLACVTLLAAIFVLLATFLPESTVNMPVFNSNLTFSIEAVRINLLLLVLCGLCTSVMWGNIFNLAVEGLGKYTAKAAGIFMMMVCGGGILPMLQGLLADHIGYLNSYWLIFVGIIYMFWYAVVGSKNVNKDIVTE